MAKGSTAKVNVINKISEIFGDDFIGEIDKKVYIWADDGGDRVQIALALTCPKTPVDVPDKHPVQKVEDWDFSSEQANERKVVERATITEEETQRVADLMKSLGL